MLHKIKMLMIKIKNFLVNNGWLIVRSILFLLAFVNITLQILGFPSLEIDGNQLVQDMANLISGLVFINSFWTNNNFTKASQEAQLVLDKIKLENKIQKLENTNK